MLSRTIVFSCFASVTGFIPATAATILQEYCPHQIMCKVQDGTVNCIPGNSPEKIPDVLFLQLPRDYSYFPLTAEIKEIGYSQDPRMPKSPYAYCRYADVSGAAADVVYGHEQIFHVGYTGNGWQSIPDRNAYTCTDLQNPQNCSFVLMQ